MGRLIKRRPEDFSADSVRVVAEQSPADYGLHIATDHGRPKRNREVPIKKRARTGSLPLTEINTRTVQSFVAYLATGGRSKKTVENVLLTLSSILRVAKSWDYACGSFKLADITMPREGIKKEQRCFRDEEVRKIIAAAPEPFGSIVAVTSVLGLRIGETLALRISDIDFTKHVIRIRQSVDAATRNVQTVKSSASSADVPMPTQLEARLRTLLQKHDGKRELLFVNRRGRPFSANKLREKQLHPLLVKLGIHAGAFIR
jgi:integrase